jgi:ADP-heptose:LPS heptosyltransferase
MEIIRHAVLFIGVDSGFAHVANALAIPSVLLLGRYRNFDSYLPVRLRKTDIVVRSAAQAFTIEARQVIDVLESYESAHFDMG